MTDREPTDAKLANLRTLIQHARSMPMSASCVINRNEVLAAIDEVIHSLPDEFAQARKVIDEADAKVAAGEAEAQRLVDAAEKRMSQLAEDSEVVKAAEVMAAQVRAEAATDAAALRRETDVFIDSRMASFESVLHKTASQVKVARARLSERSSLD